ncbi:MAG: VOC family protein [Tannerellaceae bacterium]|jgi:PhnB protein|nr:VOC family protein [Tannerellaceae bacterium]
MKIRPYLTYVDNCAEAIELYKRAFRTDTIECLRLSDMPPVEGFVITDEYKNRILQATLKLGDDFIRMSDCGPVQALNASETERISIAVETTIGEVKYAFGILAEEGRVAMPLEETFYSPCAGVVFDKFGVMWNFVGYGE